MKLRDKIGEVATHAATTWRWSGPLLWSTDRRHCVLVAGCTLLGALAAPATVLAMAQVVALVQSGLASGAAAPHAMRLWIALAGCAALLTTLTTSLRKYSIQRLVDGVGLRSRQMVLEHAAQLDLASIENLETQNELALATQDAGGVLVRSLTESVSVFASAVQLACLAAIMLTIEPWGSLAAVCAALPLLASGGLLSMMRHRLRGEHALTQRWSRYYARHLSNNQLAPAVRVLGLADWMIQRSSEQLETLQAARRRVDRWELVARIGMSAVAIFLLIAAIQSVARQTTTGGIEMGRFVAFWMAAWRLAKESTSLAQSISAASDAWLAVDRLRTFLHRPTDEGRRPTTPIRRIAEPLCGEIAIERVSFRYPLAQRDALADVSLHIRSGESIAIVGHNGAGKTTLAKLLAGLYAPTTGSLSYDGVPFDQVDLAQLYRRMAILMQRPLRLEATLHENIALGDWDRLAHDRAAVERLAEQTGLQPIVDRLPAKYDTRLGRMFGDHDLSGGQWQKVAIARALACDPRIVLFDEPTSGLDVYAEAELLHSMRRLAAGRTTIIVSHRFSTVANADRIVVLEEGRVVEQGSHAHLLAQSGLYASMWHAQRRVA